MLDTLFSGGHLAAEVLKYAGVDPKWENGIDAVNTARLAMEGRMGGKEVTEHLVKDAGNWFITKELEKKGLPAPLAAALGDAASHFLLEKVADFGYDLVTGGKSSPKITGGEEVQAPGAPAGGLNLAALLKGIGAAKTA